MNNSNDTKVTTKFLNEEKYYNLFDSEHENTPKIIIDDHSVIEPEPPKEATESNRSSLETIPIEEKKPSQTQDEMIVANGKIHTHSHHYLKSAIRFLFLCQCFEKEESLLSDKHSSSDSVGPLKEKNNCCPCLFSSKAKTFSEISTARTEFDIVREAIIEAEKKQPKNT